jgi:hypothetical protein
MSEEGEAIIPTKLGKFFPYYMKSKMPEVFNILMRQQNSDMADTTVIPIFGYTPEAQKQQINIDGKATTVELAMATTKDIMRIKATPSTMSLHKYLVIIKSNKKESVMNEIQIFRQIQGPLEHQPTNFPVPHCGGSKKKVGLPNPRQTKEVNKSTTTYMVSLETLALANNPQDAGPSSPLKRYRKFTISYANAAKSGILHNINPADQYVIGNNTAGNATTNTNIQDSGASTSNHQIHQEKTSNDTSNSTGSSLSCSLTNSKISSMPTNLDSELKALKNNLERRMDKQEEQMSEIVQVIKTMNEDFEQ